MTFTHVKTCSCGSDAIEPELLRPGQPGHGTHYSKLVCRDCGRSNGWGRDPRIATAAYKRQTQIGALLKSPNVTMWERTFLQSVSRQRHLTERQSAVLAKIHARLKP